MKSEMDLAQIKDYWEGAAGRYQAEAAVKPTTREPFLGQLESRNILAHLDPKKQLTALEIGSGDGTHTLKYARAVKSLHCLDVSPSFAQIAEQRLAAEGLDNVKFTVGSALELDQTYEDETFDRVISQRCLINLAEWTFQKEVISKAHRLLKKGGLLLLTEGFQDRLDDLDAARLQFGLPKYRFAPFNRYLRTDELEDFIANDFRVVDVRDYGAYLFLSHVFHPLAVAPEEPKHDSPINEISMRMQDLLDPSSFEKYSYFLFYALQKK